MVGMTLGVLAGALMGEEEKLRIRRMLNKQAGRLRKEYERSIRGVAIRAKHFVKEHLHP